MATARVIQEELLKELANRSELSDWFGREDTAPPAVVVKKPNPKNIQNAEKIKELEEQIHRYVEFRPCPNFTKSVAGTGPCTKPIQKIKVEKSQILKGRDVNKTKQTPSR